MNHGFVKFYRESLESAVFQSEKIWRVWSFLLLSVNYKERKAPFKGTDISVPAGAILTGRKKLSEALNLSEKEVRTALNYLEETKRISIETTTRFSIIYVENWGNYQGVEENSKGQHFRQKRANQGPALGPTDREKRANQKVVESNEFYTQNVDACDDEETTKGQRILKKGPTKGQRLGQPRANQGPQYKKERIISSPKVEDIKTTTPTPSKGGSPSAPPTVSSSLSQKFLFLDQLVNAESVDVVQLKALAELFTQMQVDLFNSGKSKLKRKIENPKGYAGKTYRNLLTSSEKLAEVKIMAQAVYDFLLDRQKKMEQQAVIEFNRQLAMQVNQVAIKRGSDAKNAWDELSEAQKSVWMEQAKKSLPDTLKGLDSAVKAQARVLFSETMNPQVVSV